ncbi:MAG TPA: DUF1491 family protein [Dongiaceae bacterium]
MDPRVKPEDDISAKWCRSLAPAFLAPAFTAVILGLDPRIHIGIKIGAHHAVWRIGISMTEARLPSDILVMATVRRCNNQGLFAAVLHRGDDWGGAIIVKLNLLDGTSKLLTQSRDLDSKVAWLAVNKGVALSESEAGDYIERQVKRDPDLWVVEIEDRDGRNPFEGKIL